MKKLFIIAIGLLWLQSTNSLFAQTRITTTKKALSQQKTLDENFKKYDLFEVKTKELVSKITADDYNGKILFEFQENLNWDLSLFPNSTLASEYTVKVATESGDQIVHPTNNITYVGYLNNESDSDVRLTITDGFIYGFVREKTRTYYIEPARHFESLAERDMHVIYSSNDVIENPNITCAHEDADDFAKKVDHEALAENDDNCITLKIALASDYLMYQKYNSSVDDVIARNIGVLNNVQANFINEFDLDIEFEIATQFVSSCSTCDPWSNTTSPGGLLYEVRDWGENGGFGTQDFAIAQFWTNRDFDGTVVGYAFVNGLCINKRYHLLQDFVDDAEQIRVMTTHEMGHNMGSGHDTYGEFAIMAPNLTTFTNWSESSKGHINNAIALKIADHPTCMPTCAPVDVPTVNFNTEGSSQLCVGETVVFKDRSLGAVDGWSWSFPGGYPSSSYDQNVAVTYNQPGTYEVTLVASNSLGSSMPMTKTSYIKVYDEAPEPANCIPGGNPGTGGIKKFVLNEINHASSLANVDDIVYTDHSCNYTTDLLPNKEYPIYLYIGYCFGTQSFPEYFKVFIDYNNDGDFDDEDELVADSGNEAYCGVAPMQLFTTPSNPVFDNFLRVRVISDVNPFSDACYVPIEGQVEDYGVRFKKPDVFAYQPSSCQTETVQDASGNEWINIFTNHQLVASVNPNGNDLGNLSVDFDVLPSIPQSNGVSFLPRNFNFSCDGPDCNGAYFPSPVSVKLYYLEQELINYNIETGLYVDFNNMNISHYSGPNEDCDPLNNGGGSTEIIFASDINNYQYISENSQAHVLEFDMNHFSEASATGTLNVLSIAIENFKAQYDGEKVNLNWDLEEVNDQGKFTIERLTSGSWMALGSINAKQGVKTYSYADINPINGSNSYRIRFDNNGESNHSQIQIVSIESSENIKILSNPVIDESLRLTINANSDELRVLTLLDASGKVIQSNTQQITVGANEYSMDLQDITSGIYFINVQGASHRNTIKFVKI